jgi:GntR family transcriptional regulator/MocR family aminotransferase
MHIVGHLPEGLDDLEVSKRAAAAGLRVTPLSPHRLSVAGPPGLVLGRAAFDESAIRQGVERLAEVSSPIVS